MGMRDPEAGLVEESRDETGQSRMCLGDPESKSRLDEANAKSLLPLVADSGLQGHD